MVTLEGEMARFNEAYFMYLGSLQLLEPHDKRLKEYRENLENMRYNILKRFGKDLSASTNRR